MSEWNAVGYSHISELQGAMADEQLSRLDLEAVERILDVGCGDGKITAKIAARLAGGAVLGIDSSREMIAFAANHFDAGDFPNLRFDVADVRNLLYRSEFDLIVSFNVLHWVPEQGEALSAIYEALKPGGRVVLRFVPEGERQCIEDVVEETRASARWGDYFRGFSRPYAHFTATQYQALAELNGFEVVGIQVTDHAWDFQTREAFAAYCRVTLIEWTRLLPEGEKSDFIEDVLRRYQCVAARGEQEAHTFKFYQMDVALKRTS